MKIQCYLTMVTMVHEKDYSVEWCNEVRKECSKGGVFLVYGERYKINKSEPSPWWRVFMKWSIDQGIEIGKVLSNMKIPYDEGFKRLNLTSLRKEKRKRKDKAPNLLTPKIPRIKIERMENVVDAELVDAELVDAELVDAMEKEGVVSAVAVPVADGDDDTIPDSVCKAVPIKQEYIAEDEAALKLFDCGLKEIVEIAGNDKIQSIGYTQSMTQNPAEKISIKFQLAVSSRKDAKKQCHAMNNNPIMQSEHMYGTPPTPLRWTFSVHDMEDGTGSCVIKSTLMTSSTLRAMDVLRESKEIQNILNAEAHVAKKEAHALEVATVKTFLRQLTVVMGLQSFYELTHDIFLVFNMLQNEYTLVFALTGKPDLTGETPLPSNIAQLVGSATLLHRGNDVWMLSFPLPFLRDDETRDHAINQLIDQFRILI